MRFYENITIFYHTANEHKDLESWIENRSLAALMPQTIMIHAHRRVNYNERFGYKNIECNQYLSQQFLLG